MYDEENDRIQAENNKRRGALEANLTAEMTKRGFKVHKKFGLLVIDDLNTDFHIHEVDNRSWRRTSDKLYVTFKLDHRRYQRAYVAREGKKGFNVTKIADELERRINLKKSLEESRKKSNEIRENNEQIAKEINSVLGLTEADDYYALTDRSGRLGVHLPLDLTPNEVTAILRYLKNNP